MNVSFKSTERWTHRGVKDIPEAHKMFRDFWNKEEFSLKILDRVRFFQKVRKIFKTKRRKCTFGVEYFFAHLNIEGVKETKKVFGKSKVYRYKAILKKQCDIFTISQRPFCFVGVGIYIYMENALNALFPLKSYVQKSSGYSLQ